MEDLSLREATQDDARRPSPLQEADQKHQYRESRRLVCDGDNLLKLMEQDEKFAEGYVERDAARAVSAPDPGESSII